MFCQQDIWRCFDCVKTRYLKTFLLCQNKIFEDVLIVSKYLVSRIFEDVLIVSKLLVNKIFEDVLVVPKYHQQDVWRCFHCVKISCWQGFVTFTHLIRNIPTHIKLWARYVDNIYLCYFQMTLITMIILYRWICFLTVINSQLKLNVSKRLHFYTLFFLHRAESNFEYSVCHKPANKIAPLRFLSFYDVKK